MLIAMFGIVPEPTHSLEDLLYLFSRTAFVAYFSLLGVVVIICLVIVRKQMPCVDWRTNDPILSSLQTHLVEFSLAKRIAHARTSLSMTTTPTNDNDEEEEIRGENNATVMMTGISDVAAEATVGERTPLLDRKSYRSSSTSSLLHEDFEPQFERKIKRTRLGLAIAYASFSGILSGMCLLFAKSGVELLVLTFGGDNQFWRWQAWMLLLGLVVFALLQLWYMHKALTLDDPTLVCPCE